MGLFHFRLLICTAMLALGTNVQAASDAATCVISGTVWAAGAANPENACEVCDPTRDVELWSDAVRGTSCASDGLACTLDACDGSGGCRHEAALDCVAPDTQVWEVTIYGDAE